MTTMTRTTTTEEDRDEHIASHRVTSARGVAIGGAPGGSTRQTPTRALYTRSATFDRRVCGDVRSWLCVCVCVYTTTTTTHSRTHSYARERPTVVEGGGFARAELGGEFRFQFPIVVGGGDGDTSARVSRAARAAWVSCGRTGGCVADVARHWWCVCVRRAEGDGARAVDVARARDRGGVQVA